MAMKPPRSAAATGYLMLAAPVLFWGGSYRAVAIAGPHATALTLNALRAVIAAGLLVVLLPLLRGRFPTGILLGWAAITGVLGVVVFLEGFSEAVLRSGAGNAAVLSNTSPFFVLLLGRLILGERMKPAGMLGLCVGFAGVVTMVSSQLGGAHGGKFALGLAMALAAGAGWGVSTLMVKLLAQRDPNLDVLGLTTAQYLVGGGILGVLALAIDGTGGAQWSSGDLWGAVMFMAAGASVAAIVLFFAALKRLPATVASSAQFLVPVVAVLIEIVRGNTPGGVVLLGMAITVGGVALVNLAPQLRLPSRSAASR
jgi:drug/metabolite transporter (DMT)-like permease